MSWSPHQNVTFSKKAAPPNQQENYKMQTLQSKKNDDTLSSGSEPVMVTNEHSSAASEADS